MVQDVWGTQIQGHVIYTIWRKLHILGQKSKQLHQEYSTIKQKLNKFRTQLQDVQ